MTGEMTLSLSSGAILIGLGAFHGINPGMGWLFAVALGMQERRRTAVWRALLPLGAGHILAGGAALAVAGGFWPRPPLPLFRRPACAVLPLLRLFPLFSPSPAPRV